MKTINCKTYRCSKNDEMYLYIHESKTIDDLPDELIHLVKNITHVIDLELTSERKLAREDVSIVMRNLEEKGYYLQMPLQCIKTGSVRRRLIYYRNIKKFLPSIFQDINFIFLLIDCKLVIINIALVAQLDDVQEHKCRGRHGAESD